MIPIPEVELHVLQLSCVTMVFLMFDGAQRCTGQRCKSVNSWQSSPLRGKLTNTKEQLKIHFTITSSSGNVYETQMSSESLDWAYNVCAVT